MGNGYVYIVVSDGEPDLCKIGFTDRDPSIRVRELDNSGSPHPLREHRRWKVWNARDHEQAIHGRLQNSRLRKEWFQLTADEAAAQIDEIVEALNQPWRPTPSEIEMQRQQAEWAERARLAREADALKQQQKRIERLQKERAAFWQKYDELEKPWQPVAESIAMLLGVAGAWWVVIPEPSVGQPWRALISIGAVVATLFILHRVAALFSEIPKAINAPRERKSMEASDTYKLGRPDPD